MLRKIINLRSIFSMMWRDYMYEIDINHESHNELRGSVYGYVTSNYSNGLRYISSKCSKYEINAFLDTLPPTYAVLKSMKVDESGRGCGVGTKMLDNFIEDSAYHGAKAIYLIADTLESNYFDIVEWYTSYGFERLDITNKYCPLMIKLLD